MKIENLLEAGVHFGHRVTKWNPRMAPFIFGERNGIHIIDLIQTLNYLDEASKFLEQFARRSKSANVLFVGTKKQASSLIEQCANKINGNDSLHAHYVNHRWLGGLLTNWSTMKICIDQLNDLEKREQNGEFQNLPKKERSILKKQSEKLNKFFGGIKKLKQRPDVVIIVGQDHEMNAVRECNKLQEVNTLRTITLLDTNCDPSLADIFVPANDDSTKSIELILGEFTNALIA